MRLLFDTDGIPPYVPAGFNFATLIDSIGRVVVPVFLYALYCVATNAWSSEDTVCTCMQRLLDIFAYLEDNKIPFDQVSVGNLTDYRDFKLKVGVGGKRCAATTVNKAIDLFKAYWTWALQKKHIAEIAAVSIAEYKIRTRGLPAFTNIRLPVLDEIRLFRSSLRGPEQLIATDLTFSVGLRRAEVVGLPADILLPIENMEQRYGAVLLKLDGYHAHTKGSRARTVEIPLRLYCELLNYKMCDRRATRLERCNEASETLLVNKYGNRCNPDWLNDVFARANELSGLHLHPHLLRHWYATRFLEYETPIRFAGSETAAVQKLQQLLGHSDVKTTLGYIHLALLGKSEKVRALTKYHTMLNALLEERVYA